MNIWHFSDSHNAHEKINLPNLKEVDVVVFSGDESNYKDPSLNEKEFFEFIDWYGKLEHSNKIMIAGNHSAFIDTYKKDAEREIKDRGIIYLNKKQVTINGKVFYGEPTTPNFGSWYFMASRDKLHKHYELIPDYCHVLITHGPPKGILDLSVNRKNNLEFCGCSALRRVIKNHKTLQLNCFGHIHSNYDFDNHGILYRDGKIYSNGACVRDGVMGEIYHDGNIIQID